ncbi:hypothetical protein TKK_0015930 [Trichogramma kaykai]
MRRVLIYSTLLLNLFSCQLVHSLPTSELITRSDVIQEILTAFTHGQEEFDDLDKHGGLHQNLVLLVGSSKAKKDFISDHSSEIVDLTSNVTILPQLVLNTRTKTEFLDFSTLDEEIKSTQYIAKVYFTKKIVDSVSAVKLLLLIDFPSFDKQIDALLQKAAESIEDIEKFLDSIGLIVTQVQNKQQIEKVKSHLKSLVNSPTASKKTASIINALYVEYEEYDDWDRLGFVEKSSDGSLESHKIEEPDLVIYESIGFTSHDSNDFIYVQCQNALPDCASLIDQLSQNLSDKFSQIGQEMIDSHVMIEKHLHDIEKSNLYFFYVNQIFKSKKLLTNSIKSPGQLIERIVEYMRAGTVDLSSENLQLSANYAKYLVFLQGSDVTEETYSSLRDQLIPVSEYLNSSTQWYEFLSNLDKNSLSAFNVQQDISKYKEVTSQLLEQTQKAKREKNYDITKSLTNFLNLIPGRNAAQILDDLKGIQLDVPKLEALEKLLSGALMHNSVDIQCNIESKKLTIKGSYVKLSDVSKSNCNDANFIEVFALYKIFFDEDLDKVGKKVHLTIIAPRWDVIGNRKIKLDGAAGKLHDEFKARNSVGPGNKGEDGKPGLPGGPAGNFLGIGRFFTNSGNLYVSAQGGKGGAGQFGGDGTEEDNGGNGGARGFGGKSGTVTIIGLDKTNPKINFNTKEGEIGDYGIGGWGMTSGIADFNSKGRKSPEILMPLTFDRSINSYQCYLRENQIANVRELLMERFSRLLAHSEAVINLYDVVGLVDEFRGLEDQFFQLNPKMSLLPAYRSLLYRIKKYAKKLESSEQLSQNKVNVLRYVYTAALSKIVNLENNVDANLVVDLNTFLNAIKSDIDSVPELKNTHIINGYKRDYLQELKAKIEEAQRYVNDLISPEIHNVIRRLDNEVLVLVNETVALQETAQEEKKELIKQQEKLKSSMILSAVFNAIKVASLFLNFLGPIGSAVSMAIIGVTSVSESLLIDSSSVDQNALLKLPGALKQSLSPLTANIKKQQDLLSEQLYDAQSMFNAFSEQEKPDIKDIENKIRAAQKALKEEIGQGNSYDPASIDKMYSLRKEIKDLCSEKITLLEKQKPLVNAKVSKQLKLVGHVQSIVSIAEMSVDAYKQIRSQKSKIDETGDLIRSAELKFEQLKQYERNIYKIVVPVCREIEVSVDQMQERLKDQSSAALIISKWRIQNALSDVMKEIKKMTEGFQVQGEFSDIFNKVEESMNIMIKLYNTMDEYHYKAELGAFIANINTHPPKAVLTNNTDLSEAVNHLMLVIQNNVVMQNYKVAINAIQHNVFPFAHEFFRIYNLPSNLETNDTNAIVSYVSSELDQLKNELLKSDAVIDKYDRFVHQNIVFNGRKGTSKPFYTWKYNEHKNNIEKLLKGQEVVLKADIKHGFKGNAIKFNKIGINFTSPNKTIEQKLRNLLQDFSVTLTHLGHSFYRCDDKVYLIPSANQTIQYSMNQHDGSNVPVTTNKVYDKIAKNQPVLSPYATWQIQLNHDENDFDELSKYANEMIDLVLEGTGQYIDLNLDVCNNQLDQYYIRTDNQTNGIQIYDKTPELNLKSDEGVINDLWVSRRVRRIRANATKVTSLSIDKKVSFDKRNVDDLVYKLSALRFENDSYIDYKELQRRLLLLCSYQTIPYLCKTRDRQW